ncbi:MAG: GtrA family protein [Methanobrevibacter sp.]|jgi:putative flippase GtrA|nr:GtrA family protein [Candidatus Methanovirga procula]
MISKIFSLLKNKEVMLYGVFGVLTTVVNIAAYQFFLDFLHIENMISNAIAIIISVLFAYITNKIWVFESKNKKIHIEFALFMGGRAFSGIVDESLMFLFLHILNFDFNIILGISAAKVVSQIIVIVLNYVLSKGVVFK